MMNTQQLRELMLKELPGMMQNDSAFRETILSIGHAQFANKAETESYFGQMMARFDRALEEEHKTQAKLVSAIDKLEQRFDINQSKHQEQMASFLSALESVEKRFDSFEKRFDLKIEENQKTSKDNSQLWQANQQQMATFLSAVERVEKCLESFEKRFESVEKRLESFEKRFDLKIEEDQKTSEANSLLWQANHKQIASLTSAVQSLVKQIESLEKRFDLKVEEDRKKWVENERLWQENHKQIASLTSALQSLGKQIESLEKRFDIKVEEDRKKWAENDKRWEDNERRWEENHKQIASLTSAIQSLEKRLDSLEQRFELKVEEDRKRWADNEKRWDENERRLEANKKEILNRMEQKLGALGARWGMQSEGAFRNALRGILKEFPEIQVINVDERDEEGVVFGYPEQVELDLIVKNGVLIIAEIKAHLAKHDVHIFQNKVRFYEQKHGRQATRRIVISPQMDEKAIDYAKQLGIESYSYIEHVGL